MRKFFALALAVAMVLSLASVSFAANTVADIELVGPYRYDADIDAMKDVKAGEDVNRYGDGAYYIIMIGDGTTMGAATANLQPVQSYKMVEKLKAKAEFEQGEDLVESVTIVKKYVDVDADADDSTVAQDDFNIVKADQPLDGATSGYYYFVEFKTIKKETTADADIVATVEFDRKADDEVNKANGGIGRIKDDECEVEYTAFYANAYVKNGTTNNACVVKDSVALKYDTDYALKFDCDEEVELEFGDAKNGGTNEGTFTVDVSGQGKLYLRYNTKANEAIANANPGVDMKFVNFNNVKFNRVGEFVYEMEDMVAAYKVVGDQLVEIQGASFDTDEVSFYTRLLGSYVFATAELVNPVAEAPVVEAPVATNPSTGF